MKLTLHRQIHTDKSTIGTLSIDGVFECFTLEDVERDVKIKHETAIPKGRYEVIITMSNRFKIELPLLLNVPNFEGVRIHSGNTAADSSGCILLGTSEAIDFVGNSRIAMKAFMPKLRSGLKKGKVYIDIS